MKKDGKDKGPRTRARKIKFHISIPPKARAGGEPPTQKKKKAKKVVREKKKRKKGQNRQSVERVVLAVKGWLQVALNHFS
jgi:hypothetical protein